MNGIFISTKDGRVTQRKKHGRGHPGILETDQFLGNQSEKDLPLSLLSGTDHLATHRFLS